MIKILDKNGKMSFVVNDNDTEPVPVEEIIKNLKKKKKKEKEIAEVEEK